MADFHITQNDTAPAIEATLKDSDGNAVDISGGSVTFHMRAKGETTTKVNASAKIVDSANGKVKYEWASGDTDTFGMFDAEWEVKYSDGSIETFPSNGFTEISIRKEIA